MQDVLRDLAPRYAGLLAVYGDTLVEPELVEPTGRFFPDPFGLDAESVARMLKRMMMYAPLGERVSFELAFASPEGEAGGGGGCGSGACGPGGPGGVAASGEVAPLGDGRYGVMLQVGDVGDPIVLAACLARAVGGMILHEAGEAAPARSLGAASELAASVCGLGLLLLNGASIYKKGCGGLREHRATQLGLAEHAVATALFCRLHKRPTRAVRSHLATTQAEAFDEALRWVDGNDALLAQMRTAPELVAAGALKIEEPRGFLARLFGGRHASEPPMKELAAARSSRAPRSAEEQRRIAETRALVEQALSAGPNPSDR